MLTTIYSQYFPQVLHKLFRVTLFEGAGWKADSDLNEDAVIAETGEFKKEKSTLTQSEFLATRSTVEKILSLTSGTTNKTGNCIKNYLISFPTIIYLLIRDSGSYIEWKIIDIVLMFLVVDLRILLKIKNNLL